MEPESNRADPTVDKLDDESDDDSVESDDGGAESMASGSSLPYFLDMLRTPNHRHQPTARAQHSTQHNTQHSTAQLQATRTHTCR